MDGRSYRGDFRPDQFRTAYRFRRIWQGVFVLTGSFTKREHDLSSDMSSCTMVCPIVHGQRVEEEACHILVNEVYASATER